MCIRIHQTIDVAQNKGLSLTSTAYSCFHSHLASENLNSTLSLGAFSSLSRKLRSLNIDYDGQTATVSPLKSHCVRVQLFAHPPFSPLKVLNFLRLLKRSILFSTSLSSTVSAQPAISQHLGQKFLNLGRY